MSAELQSCLAAATNEVLRHHFFTMCEPAQAEPAPAEGSEYHQSFGGTLHGTLSLKLDPCLAAALASRYCPESPDIRDVIIDLQRMICGSVLHRFRPGAKVRFDVSPGSRQVAERDDALVTLRLVDGLLQVGMRISQAGSA